MKNYKNTIVNFLIISTVLFGNMLPTLARADLDGDFGYAASRYIALCYGLDFVAEKKCPLIVREEPFSCISKLTKMLPTRKQDEFSRAVRSQLSEGINAGVAYGGAVYTELSKRGGNVCGSFNQKISTEMTTLLQSLKVTASKY